MRWPLASSLVVLLLSRPGAASAQQAKPARDTTLETGVSAGEADAEPKARRLVKWNEFDGKFLTLRVGAGFLVDYATYAQDDASKQHFTLDPGFKIRDSRIMIRGRFKTKRRITYQAGFMYDGYTDTWFLRQTGIMVAVPEAWGHFWVGRAKEGVSLNKIMVGYDGWTEERFTFSDAIPLLADGVKWLGYLPSRHLIWNVGWFTDVFSEGQSFSYFDHQIGARAAWVPMVSDTAGTLLHIGFAYQDGKPNQDTLRVKSKPEDSASPNFIDTGKFPATRARLYGPEIYYRRGPWLFGTEYYWDKVSSPQTGNPVLQGGDVSVSWLVTGETRSYNTVGGYFRAVSPRKSIFEGGPGAWEAVLRFSYSDLDAGTLQGGKFWRITPMVNWHLSDNARLELVYGYGTLDRFQVKGKTQFFQTRLQLQL